MSETGKVQGIVPNPTQSCLLTVSRAQTHGENFISEIRLTAASFSRSRVEDETLDKEGDRPRIQIGNGEAWCETSVNKRVKEVSPGVCTIPHLDRAVALTTRLVSVEASPVT